MSGGPTGIAKDELFVAHQTKIVAVGWWQNSCTMVTVIYLWPNIVMAYVVMAYVVMAYVAMASVAMASVVMASVVMAY